MSASPDRGDAAPDRAPGSGEGARPAGPGDPDDLDLVIDGEGDDPAADGDADPDAPAAGRSTSGERRLAARLAELSSAEVARGGDGRLSEAIIRAPGAPVGGLRFGRYRIVAEIARGGMGVLYRAQDTRADSDEGRRLASEVALKVVLTRKQKAKVERDVSRFIEEIRALITVRHPNVVRIFDAGREEGLHYYTMERIEGVSMRQLMADARVPLLLALEAARQVALALGELHGRRLLHRDLKPDNILIDRRPSPFRPVLIDFGLILSPDRLGRYRRELVGTPAYMAPEQASTDARFGEVGPWTDVYALGASLYAMVTGRPPFIGTKAQELLKDVREREPRAPASVRPGLPREVDALVRRAMARRADDRYPSALALAEALDDLIQGFRRAIRAADTWRRLRRLFSRAPRRG